MSNNIQLGSIIVYKGTGLVYSILGALLRLFEPSWDGWGWHTSVVVGRVFGLKSSGDYRWKVLESTARGVRLVSLPNSQGYKQGFRVYNWIDFFSQLKADDFVSKHRNEAYDIAVYFWTTLAYFARKFWGRPIPRLFDARWSCWELVYYFCDRMGEPLAESYDFPLISDMIKILEKKNV